MRFTPDAFYGLTAEQVRQQQAAQLVNQDSTVPTKSVGTIVLQNICTLFNLINGLLALAILSVGSYKNMLFMGVVLSNLCIGIIQEIRAKRAIDRLSLLHAAKATVIREGHPMELPIDQIVLDDVLLLQNGNQAMVDTMVLEGHCEVDESFITGEADAIFKGPGDAILAGSVILSGTCRARADKISGDTYIASISREARYYKKTKSEIMDTLNRIIGIISIIIIPTGLILLQNQLGLPGNTYTEAVVQTVAALIGMIPEGLVLLSSTVLAVSVVRLSQRQVMVQDLYCIESLARVDTLCLDKTGTLTQGELVVTDLIPMDATQNRDAMEAILSQLTGTLEDDNSTFRALRQTCPPRQDWQAVATVPFSSRYKWSGVTFAQQDSYILGAAEFVCPHLDETQKQQLAQYSQHHRVLLLARTAGAIAPGVLPEAVTPVGWILLQDQLRLSVRQTLEYFSQQDVTLKVISGDSAPTVAGIAREAGVPHWERYIDLTTVDSASALAQAAEQYTIFGRVTPAQKKQLVQALQQQGHTVAMTGDGVNDVLALKQADCSIAMAAGTDAARNVSQLVLLNSDFDALPHILAEGRRSINNIQRSASLFLVKTVYATLFALIFLFVQLPYPFIPIQLTLISCLTIGIPSFLLALEPNRERIRGRFLYNILGKALPGGLTIVINLIAILLCAEQLHFSTEEISTLCVLLTGFTGFLVLRRICLPFHRHRLLMYVGLVVLFIGATVLLPGLFSLVPLQEAAGCFFLAFLPVDYLVFRIIYGTMQHLLYDRRS